MRASVRFDGVTAFINNLTFMCLLPLFLQSTPLNAIGGVVSFVSAIHLAVLRSSAVWIDSKSEPYPTYKYYLFRLLRAYYTRKMVTSSAHADKLSCCDILVHSVDSIR